MPAAAAIAEHFDRAAGFTGFRAVARGFNDSHGISQLSLARDRINELGAMALRDPSRGARPVTFTNENTHALFEDVI